MESSESGLEVGCTLEGASETVTNMQSPAQMESSESGLEVGCAFEGAFETGNAMSSL